MGHGRGADRRGRSKKSEPFVMLPVSVMDSKEFLDAGCTAQAVLLQLIKRHRRPSRGKPGNNGRIAAGDRALAADLGVSKNTITRAKLALLKGGLIEIARPAVFDSARRLATEYRLTWLTCDRTKSPPVFKPEGRARAPS